MKGRERSNDLSNTFFAFYPRGGNVLEKIMCECCGINEAQGKDYRTNEVTGDVEKYWVCTNCVQLNDYWFYKFLNTPTPLGKKRVIGEGVDMLEGLKSKLASALEPLKALVAQVRLLTEPVQR
jgi:hypothetical protein